MLGATVEKYMPFQWSIFTKHTDVSAIQYSCSDSCVNKVTHAAY
jgi:hypothetical protein